MKSDPICFKHQEIISLCQELLKMDYSKPYLQKSKRILNKIIKLAEQAREDGQNMEDRLQEYYEGITEIGFSRSKRK